MRVDKNGEGAADGVLGVGRTRVLDTDLLCLTLTMSVVGINLIST